MPIHRLRRDSQPGLDADWIAAGPGGWRLDTAAVGPRRIVRPDPVTR
ncbi:hypothetical protein [Plantactinospora sp. BB1]|nr:hypothetical protein [Plantactinospora sp. BB1]